MNEMQKRIINNYYSHCGKKTLAKMAIETGIQQTRLFRILNGHDMRISEYEILRNRIWSSLGDGEEIQEVIKNVEEYLDFGDISEIGNLILRKMKRDDLRLNSQKKIVSVEAV